MKAAEASEMMDVDSQGEEGFKRSAAIIIGILAMLLAITGLGAANASKEMTNANIEASNTWAFYQAKTVRQTVLRVAADEIDMVLKRDGDLPEPARQMMQRRLDRYWQTIERYDSEPDTGEGRKELMAKARTLEAQRDHARKQDPYFDYAEALFQIAIVLASVSIVASSRLLLTFATGLGGVAALLTINGFFLFADLPFLG